MDVLSVEDVLSKVDNLLMATRSPADEMIRSLLQNGWVPNTQASAFIFGMALFVEKYGEGRESGSDVKDSLAFAQAETIKSPVVSSFLASNVSANVDRAAGV